MLTFSQSMVNSFRRSNPHLRWGQEFYDFMKLDKTNTDREFCDKLYNEADDERAKNMVALRTTPH